MHNISLEAAVTLPGETFSRVALTAVSVELLGKLWEQHGPLMFHQSGGCCDGSAPMCYPAGEFLTGDADVLLGRFDIGTGEEPRPLEFWMSKEQFNYWSHTHLTVDVVTGRGSGFSVESPEGKRFLIRSTLMDWDVPSL
ncbi:uncharacterized protein (DUF779 family) [Paenarthrobacter nicotinovorans]|uniref:DUF779 domain-containing protein n=1 Tax=Paenarthrobacter nicotinovorans TaxID=29320 RepID=A0ABV0GU62_PAENI|nr:MULTISPECIES: DUF779 domain-containing protein [Micrococcaceae]MDR6435443.1 uncharacterized protein (DUF779 family) [Paenarthrobacter nicotinovorans]BCW59846.1 hypothetical protein StoSoilB20_31930 [Arthrobacter sp. StoSoilB20]SCZ49724.1 hypothetical protein SAMN02799638_00299 [Arthrobacter sp. UNCCL28]